MSLARYLEKHAEERQTRVAGYTRGDGTEVEAHVRAYHGSPSRLSEVRPAKASGIGTFQGNNAVYAADSPEHAALYAVSKSLKGKATFAVTPKSVLIVGDAPISDGYVHEVEGRGARGTRREDAGQVALLTEKPLVPTNVRRVRATDYQDRVHRFPDRAALVEALEKHAEALPPTASGVPSMRPKYAPREHQARAVDKLFENKGKIVFAHQTGTGKTFSAIYGFEKMRHKKKANRVLVLVPSSLRENFARGGVEKFTTSSLQIVGSKTERSKLKDYVRPEEVSDDKTYTIMSYSMFRRDPVGMMRRTGADTIIADEFHRAQPLFSKVLTPAGWRRMGDMRVGDLVVDPATGLPVPVVGVHPQGRIPVFRVTFDDGSSTLCCDDHLWEVSTLDWKRGPRPVRVLPLQDIRKNYLSPRGKRKYRVRLTAPVDFAAADLPVDPYLLGVLLGDGSIVSGTVEFASVDAPLVEKVAAHIPTDMGVQHYGGVNYGVSGPRGGRRINELKSALMELGSWGCRSYEKRVPPEYLAAPLAARRELLQGLMDTDGSVGSNRGQGARFVTTSYQLAMDVQEIVRSLGGKARIYPRKRSAGGMVGGNQIKSRRQSFEVFCTLPATESPFALERKSSRWRAPQGQQYRVIADIQPAGKEESQCLTIGSASKLYITDDYIVTHNTRNDQAITYKAIAAARPFATNFIGITGSLINNKPAEIAKLLNLSEGGPPKSPRDFKRRYTQTIGIAKGFQGGKKKIVGLKDPAGFAMDVSPKVDYFESGDVKGRAMPRKVVRNEMVPMSKEQYHLYELALNRLGPVKEYITRRDPNITVKDANKLFGQLMQARQISNSVAMGRKDVSVTQSAQRTPKVRATVDAAVKHLAESPDNKVVLYSNLIRGGVDVLSAGLKGVGIPHALFIGKGTEMGDGRKVTSVSRAQGVEDFKAGRKRVIVLSGAGAEGLDLPNSTAFYALDGHFNPERVMQAEARTVRMGGQSARPPEKRVVDVRRFQSTVPKSEQPGFFGKLIGNKAPQTTDEWMYNVAGRKYETNRQFYDVLHKPTKYIRKEQVVRKDGTLDTKYTYAKKPSKGLFSRIFGGSSGPAAPTTNP
jgi:hypothetical protein